MVVSKVEGEVSEALYKKRPGNPVRSERIDECEFGCDAAEFTAFILTHSNMVREFGVHIVKIVYVVGKEVLYGACANESELFILFDAVFLCDSQACEASVLVDWFINEVTISAVVGYAVVDGSGVGCAVELDEEFLAGFEILGKIAFECFFDNAEHSAGGS